MLLLLVLARKTLNQTLKQVKKVNVAATVDKHQEVKLSPFYNEKYTGSPAMVVIQLWSENEILKWY